MPSRDPFPFDFDEFQEPRSLSPVQGQAAQIAALREELIKVRRDLDFANRAVEDAENSARIARQLTLASLTESRDLCLPHITKSLLYATVETLDDVAQDGGLSDEYQKVRKRSIEQLEKLDAKGVCTAQEEAEKGEARRRNMVLLRFADIMRPRLILDAEEAVALLSSKDPTGPRLVVDGTMGQPAHPSRP